jgi:hypothetical protein
MLKTKMSKIKTDQKREIFAGDKKMGINDWEEI